MPKKFTNTPMPYGIARMCNICNKVYMTADGAERHWMKKHEGKVRPVKKSKEQK